MHLNENTEHSSNQIRTVADLVLGWGIFISIISAIAIFIVMYTTIKNMVVTIIAACISLLIIFFGNYVVYVFISSYATFIENSDRTEVIEALDRVCDAIRGVDNTIDSTANDDTQEDDAE